MRVYLSPQINIQQKISYIFEGDKITATIGSSSDTFDFSGLPDGSINSFDISTTLPLCPICGAERDNGVLSVILLNFIGEDATETEKFPEWVEV